MFKTLFAFVTCLFFVSVSQAKLKVVATTADVHALVKEVGDDMIDLSGIARGSQDPHFIEAKPSYLIKLRDADLLVSNGLSLEIGWVPSLIRGARNPKVSPGTPGNLDLGTFIEPIEKPSGPVSRAGGDVHPDGNPHYTLDPVRVSDLAGVVAARLGELDPANKDAYAKRAADFKAREEKRIADWRARIQKTGVKKVVTYHPSMNYFLDRFGLTAVAFLEPKPGVPPTAQHTLEVIQIMKRENVKVVLVDNFYDTKIAERVTTEIPGARVASVGIAVDSAPNLKSLEDVTENLVKAIEGK